MGSCSISLKFADLYFEEKESLQLVLEPKGVDDFSWGKEEGLSLRKINEDLTIEFIYQTGREKFPLLLEEAKKIFPSSHLEGFKEGIGRSDKFSTIDLSLLLSRFTEIGKVSRVSPFINHYRLIFSTVRKTVGILTSEERLLFEERNYTRLTVFCVAERDGKLERGYEVLAYSLPPEEIDEERFYQVAKKAGERAVLMLSARRVKAGVMPVILAGEAGGTMIHEAVGHGLEADHAEEGLSVYSGRLGERVASPLITVIDDPTLSSLYGSFKFDDEGTKAQPVLLIEKGILRNFLYDQYQALKHGKPSNGRGRRESFRHIPIPRMSNTYIAKGETPAEECLKNLERGLLVKKMGGGEVNPLTGDFVFEVREGYYVEKGEVCFPVKGATLVGNGPKVLEMIDLVGDDLHFDPGTCGKDGQGVPVSDGQPTLRIPELTVGGE